MEVEIITTLKLEAGGKRGYIDSNDRRGFKRVGHWEFFGDLYRGLIIYRLAVPAEQYLVDGSADHWPEDVFLQISESHCGRAIRTPEWTYSVQAPDASPKAMGSKTYVEDFLYDLKNDPFQLNNLVASSAHADIRARLATRLRQRMAEAHEPVPEILPHQ